MGRTLADILDRQGDELDAAQDAAAARVLRVYDDARRELRERLDAMLASGLDVVTPWTAQQVAGTLAQVEAALLSRIGADLDPAVRAEQERALADLVATVEKGDKAQPGALREVETAFALKLADPLLTRLQTADVYASVRELIVLAQRETARGWAQKLTLPQLRDRLAAREGSVFAANRSLAEQAVRNTVSLAYNQAHLDGILAARETLDGPKGRPEDPLLKRADEYRDHRSHPVSPLLHYVAVLADAPFIVRAVDIARKAAEMGRPMRTTTRDGRLSSMGMVWPRQGDVFVGQAHPAHRYERGRITAWRRSWGTGADRTVYVEAGQPVPYR